MKKLYLSIILLLSVQLSFSQAFDCQLITNASGYLEYQMMETSESNPPTSTSAITDITFTVRWLSTLGSEIDLFVVECAAGYNIFKGLPTPATQGSYDYIKFGCDPIPVYPPNDWIPFEWQTIAVIRITNSVSSSGDFEIAPDGWIPEVLNFSYDSDGDDFPESYLPTITGGTTGHPFPNEFYGNKIWVGVTSTNWSTVTNWLDECGNNVLPVAGDIAYIQAGTPYSISTASGNLNMKDLIIESGATLSVPTTRTLNATGTTIVQPDAQLIILPGSSTVSTKAALGTLIAEAGALRAPGTITISPDAQITCSGPTTLASPQQLKILADATGIGSFQDNGTINYGSNGSAIIETYLSNTSGTYYFHQVGPTVDNLVSGSGVPLGDFDITTMNTFAYEWSEPTQAWVNQYLNTYSVNTGDGLMLTTDDGTSGEYAQEGSIINTNVTLNLALSGDPNTSTYGWNLKSNPYAMALDWDDVYSREDAALSAPNDLNPIIYVLDNGTSNYRTYDAITNAGTTRYIQVGQGFWLQYLTSPYTAPSNVNITLQPSDRNHSLTNFLKDEDAINQVTLTAEGNNSKDELLIAFRDYGTPNYDHFIDVDKWDSFYEDATEMWTVTNDQNRLTHNILPPMETSTSVSVPMTFKCTNIGTYTIAASEIESFESEVEIFLEDKVIGGEWIDLTTNPIYNFDVVETGIQNRFIVHFFNFTGIDDPEEKSDVTIYSWGQDAYIVNRGKETIKEYVAYDLMGRELHRGTLPNSTVNKVTIGDVSGYYIVKVTTKEGRIYNEKVYITK